MKHGHFLAFFSIVRVLFRQWGEFLDFGEGVDFMDLIIVPRCIGAPAKTWKIRATVANCQD
jgi:hypothetical protein